MSRKLRASRVVFFAAITALAALAPMALAQPRRGAPPAPKRDAAPAAVAEDAGAAAPKPEPVRPASVAADAGAASKPSDAGAVEARGADGGKVLRFGEVEIEGRLKSPQIVYFLRRVRAEFAAGDLGHRTFQSEMSETRNEPVF